LVTPVHHRQLQLPPGDLLTHAGDVTANGTRTEVLDILVWLDGLEYRHEVFTGGNQDFYLEEVE
jgi:hypothetical protein